MSVQLRQTFDVENFNILWSYASSEYVEQKIKLKNMAYNAKRPSVYVSQNGGRKKIHSEKFVYLEDKSEFDLELVNPTKETLLAKIELNGNPISNSGLVLRPGERILLKRFIDDNRAFVFNSYEVSSDSEIKDAIADNGKIRVSFYKERTVQPNLCNPSIWITYPFNQPYQPYHYPSTTPYYSTIWCESSGSSGTIVGNSIIGSTTGNYTTLNASNITYTSGTSDNIVGTSAVYNSVINEIGGTIETGRVEKGKETDQKFDKIDMDFDCFSSYTTDLQILPESRKPVEKEDLKIYCHKCGTKAKYDDNFCSKCGTKLNN